MKILSPPTTAIEELPGMELREMAEPDWFLTWQNLIEPKQPQMTYVVRDTERNEITSCLRIFWRMIQSEKRRLRAVGIGGVWTWPTRRGQGYATVLLEKTLKKLQDEALSADVVILHAPQARGLYSHLGFLEIGNGLYGTTLHPWEDMLHHAQPYVWSVLPEGHF